MSEYHFNQCDQIWRFVTILAIFKPFWQQIFCPKSPKNLLYKSFDVDILGLEKIVVSCGEKFGDFCQNVGDFFVQTPGHSDFNVEQV